MINSTITYQQIRDFGTRILKEYEAPNCKRLYVGEEELLNTLKTGLERILGISDVDGVSIEVEGGRFVHLAYKNTEIQIFNIVWKPVKIYDRGSRQIVSKRLPSYLMIKERYTRDTPFSEILESLITSGKYGQGVESNARLIQKIYNISDSSMRQFCEFILANPDVIKIFDSN